MIAGHGFIESALLGQGDTQIVVGIDVIGPECHGAMETGSRVLQPSLVLESDAQVVVHLRELRLKLQSTLEVSDRFVQASHFLIDDADIAVKGSRQRVQLDGSANVLDGRVMPAGPVGKFAEQMERVGVVGIDLQDLPVNLFRLLEIAGLMVLQSLRECFGNGWHVRQG